jgi:subtilisin-like proprotein convertase family protein
MTRIIYDSRSQTSGLGKDRRRRGARVDQRSIPQLELLETRVVPTSITLNPIKDNTLIQNTAGNLSDGAGPDFFVGLTNADSIRRGVIAFDIAGKIPAGATINSVSLKLNMDKTDGPTDTIELHKLTADWGEGTSNSNSRGGGGAGAPATTNDATWLYRFYNTLKWTNPGGDFSATVSGSTSVGDPGTYTWSSTPQMMADVQGWLNTPSSNIGWLLLGDETFVKSAKRFNSRENPTASHRPALTIDYTVGNPGASTTTVTSSANPTVFGQSVTFTATVAAVAPGAGTPTGTVTFRDGSTNLGTATLASGTATLATAALTVASHSITVNYGGDGNFFPSTSAALTQTVNAASTTGEIHGTVFEDLNGNGTKDAGEPAQSGWTVFLDQNNNGLLDKGQITLASSDAPKALPDLSTTTSTLAVSGLPGQISTLSVLLNITHTFDSDLTAVLVSPGGIRVRLFSHVGDGGQNFTNTLLDDAATVPISAGNAPFLGSFQPDRQLATLNGQNPNGTWTLEITDDRPGDSGTLQGWSLTVGFAEASATTDASGAYAFTSLAPGTYNVREVMQASAVPLTEWQQTQPGRPNFGYSVTLTSGQSSTGRDFGNDRRGQISGTVFNDANSNGVKDPGEAGLPGWVVYLDQNNNGVLDQRTLTASAADVPKTIPATTTSTAPVGKALGRILSLTVTLNVTHPKDSDLSVALTSPASTRIQLFSQVGDGGANFINTVLDDAASTAITAGTAPFTGSFRPTAALASFLGQDPAGSWTLEITNSEASNTGTLTSWSLNFTLATEPIAVSNAIGAYSFANLNPSTIPYTIREVVPTGWTQTLPTGPGPKYTVTLNSGQLVTNQDFGNAHTGGGGAPPGDPTDQLPGKGTASAEIVFALQGGAQFRGVQRMSWPVGAEVPANAALPTARLVRPSWTDEVAARQLQPELVDQVFDARASQQREEHSKPFLASGRDANLLAGELDDLWRSLAV